MQICLRFLKIEGFDEETSTETYKIEQKNSFKKKQRKFLKKLKNWVYEDDLATHKGLSLGMLLILGEDNIKTLKDFAELGYG